MSIKAAGTTLGGQLRYPRRARAVIVIVQGSGDDDKSPPGDGHLAHALNRAGLATMVVSLLTPRELGDPGRLFDVTLLARRLITVTDWLRALPATRRHPIGYLCASTGAAAAMMASTQRAPEIFAIVSHAGRPDLAAGILRYVRAPTRLIVDWSDELVLELNRSVYDVLETEKDLRVVGGGGDRYDDEAGALEELTYLCSDWFLRHLAREHDLLRAW